MPTVLIIEDDQYIREMYALILRKAGYEVTEAPDGAAGLVEAKRGGFDVILLDLMMPQMDGLTFLREMKKITLPKPNGPIIVMSNLAYNAARDEATSLGAVEFLVKADLEPKEIVATVKRALASKGSQTGL